jgi:hypothetical protein
MGKVMALGDVVGFAARRAVSRALASCTGRAGTVEALSATMNPATDVLAQGGVVEFDMPATPNWARYAISAAP